jgi:hypothetical protein
MHGQQNFKYVNFLYIAFWMPLKSPIPVLFLVTQIIFMRLVNYVMVILTKNVKVGRESTGFPVRVYYKFTLRIIRPTSWELIEALIKHWRRNPAHMHILTGT